jgi:cyanophycinase
MTGTLALVGGREFGEGCTFDSSLLAASGGDTVVVMPTAAAYEHPDQVVERATAWFGGLGARVQGLPVLSRADACSPAHAETVRGARFVYLTGGSASGGSPMHVRSVLKESPVFQALEEAWRDGAVVAGSAAGAMVLGDPMVDPRGGAFTLGLGLIELFALLPEASAWTGERLRRTISLAPEGVALVAVDERTAVIRGPDGAWATAGVGRVDVHIGGASGTLADLARW